MWSTKKRELRNFSLEEPLSETHAYPSTSDCSSIRGLRGGRFSCAVAQTDEQFAQPLAALVHPAAVSENWTNNMTMIATTARRRPRWALGAFSLPLATLLFSASGVALLFMISVSVGRAQTPSTSERSIVNTASHQPLLAPGVTVSIFGQNLASAGCIRSAATPLPTELCGASVTVDGESAAMVFASPSHLNVQIPVEIEPGPAELVVKVETRTSDPVSIFLETHAPGLFTISSTGSGVGLFSRTEGSLVGDDNPAGPGEVINALALGLGPTDPIVPTGTSPMDPLPTVTTPAFVVGCARPEILLSGLVPDFVGFYQLILQLPESLPGGRHFASLTIGGQTSNRVILPVSGPELPFICSAVSAASFSPDTSTAPGAILSIFAMNIGAAQTLSTFPATEFQGLSVAFNGMPAPLFAVVPDAGQLNVLAPTELPEMGEVEVRLNMPIGASTAFTLEMAPASPGIFTISDPSDPTKRFATALLANTAWLALPDATSEALGLPTDCAETGVNPASFCGQPLRPGDAFQLFLTGLGKATPDGNPESNPLPTGSVAPVDGKPLYLTNHEPRTHDW